LPIFVSQKDYENFNNSIILKLIKIDKNQWGNNRMLWSEYLMKYLARDGVEQLSHEEAQLLIYVIKDVSGISSYELFNWFFSEINNNYEYFDNNRISSYQKTNELARLTILENSYYVWKTIKSFEEGLNKENEKKLAEALVIGGNDSYALASCKTSSLYQKALDIRPEIFNESSLWFEELSSDKYDSDQSLCYLYDYVKYLKEILNNRAIEHIKFCQREIELSLQYAKIMMTLEPKEFNSQMQLGNVYYYLGNKKESLDAFNYCIQNYQNDNSHYGCEEAIELIEKNNYPKVAVIKIGEIIKEL